MKKIALIEDRYSRQKDFLELNNINLAKYEDIGILDNFIQDKANTLLKEIKSDSFDLQQYDIIICHKSIELKDKIDTNTIIIDKLTSYCKEQEKILVLFSGGIDANYYKENYLELNSQVFYSQNLKLFFEAVKNEDENILMLSYGLKWKINILLNILEKINNYIENTNKESDRYKRFSKDCKINLLDSLNLNITKPQIDGQNISVSEMMKYRDNIYANIKKSVTYE